MVEIDIRPLIAAGIEPAPGWIEAAIVGPGNKESIAMALESARARAFERLAQERPQDWPAISAMRGAYRKLGKDPSRYRPSAEALLRRISAGQAARTGEPDRRLRQPSLHRHRYLRRNLRSRPDRRRPSSCGRAETSETYESIGRGPLNLEGLPLLVDREGPFGSPTSDSRRSMVGATTEARSHGALRLSDRGSSMTAFSSGPGALLTEHAGVQAGSPMATLGHESETTWKAEREAEDRRDGIGRGRAGSARGDISRYRQAVPENPCLVAARRTGS